VHESIIVGRNYFSLSESKRSIANHLIKGSSLPQRLQTMRKTFDALSAFKYNSDEKQRVHSFRVNVFTSSNSDFSNFENPIIVKNVHPFVSPFQAGAQPFGAVSSIMLMNQGALRHNPGEA